MVKLIRLLSNNTDGNFENEFTSNIDIPVGSKIALSNLSLEGAESEIQITNDNNEITVQYSDTVSTTAELELGTYTQTQLPALLTDIETKLNVSVDEEAVCIGQQFKVSLNENKKVQIEKRQSFLSEYTSDWTLTNADKTTSQNNGNFYSSSLDANTSGNANAMTTDNSWCRGGAVFSCRIASLIYDEGSAGGVFNGFTLGLTRVKPSILNPIVTANIDFGIRCFGTEIEYGYYAGGVLYQDSGVPVVYNGITFQSDILEISIANGQITLAVYQYGFENYREIYTQELSAYGGTPLSDLTLYPFISFQGKKENASVMQVKYTADPFLTTSVYEPDLTPNNAQTIKSPVQQVERTEQSITWGGLSLANFLGFRNTRYPSVGTTLARNIIYTADSQFILRNVSDSIVVELLNINLSSFDGLTKQRRNFLGVVPAESNFVEGKVIYEATNLIYLDIENSTPSQLRNIRGRLLKEDLSPVSTFGSVVLTLLIKGPNE